MKRQRGEFRSAAQSARQRLGSGFWLGERVKMQHAVDIASEKGVESGVVRDFYLEKLKARISSADVPDELYLRVASILKDYPQSNPLSLVLDRVYMTTLSDSDRERYVLNLSRDVKDCVSRYNREQEMSAFV